MGNLKDKALKNDQPSEDTQTHTLLPDEIAYLRLLNAALLYHTFGPQIISNFLFYVCVHRLGYPELSNLQFAFNFADEEATQLTVTQLPVSPTPPADAPIDK